MNFLQIFFLIIFSALSINYQMTASSLNGTTSIIYKNIPYVFHNGDQATGFVALKKGFTVPSLQGVRLNLSMPASYGMDLRSTGSIVLENDLRLDSGFTLSSSGTIRGNGYSLILNDDLIIPELSTLKITSTLKIEGNGHTIYLDNFAQILTDPHSTLTLRNLIIQNVKNSPGHAVVAANGFDSKIAFDNVEFILNDDFHVNKGSFFFHNDVIFTGDAQFFYRSSQESFIAPHSTLSFDKGSSFYYCCPLSIPNGNPISMQDPSSRMYFCGSDFKTTPPGMTLSEGNIFFKDLANVAGGVSIVNPLLPSNADIYGTQVKSYDWSPDGQFLAVAGNGATSWGGFNDSNQIRIYRLDLSDMDYLVTATSMPYGGTLNSIAWSPDGGYLAVGGSDPSSVGGFNNNDAVRVYRFDVAKMKLYAFASVGYGTGKTVDVVLWHPSGKYLSVCGNQPILGSGGFNDQNNIRVYFFDTIFAALQPFASVTYDLSDPLSEVTSSSWRISSEYLAAVGNSTSPKLRYFYFDTSNSNLSNRLTLYYEEPTNVSNPNSTSFSPDGRFVFVGGSGAGSVNHIQMLKFNEAVYPPTTSLFLYGMGTVANRISGVKWHPTGNYLVFGNNYYLSGYADSHICSFDYDDASEAWMFDFISNQRYGQTIYSTIFNPVYDFMTVGGQAPTRFGSMLDTDDEIQTYRFLSGEFRMVKNITNTGTNGGGTFSSDWSVDGKYIADAVYFPSVGNQINLYSFDTASNATKLLDSKSYGENVNSVSFSPNCQYLAVTGYNPSSGGGFANSDHIRIYKIQNNLLTAVTSQPLGTATAIGYVVAWHQSGKFLAIGSQNAASGYGGFADTNNIRIYSFDGTTLTALTSINFGTQCRDLYWSPDGQKLLAGGVGTGSPRHDVVIYTFDAYSSLLKRVGVEYGSGTPSVLKAKWNIDEQNIAITGSMPDNVGGFSSSDVLRIYTFDNFNLIPSDSNTISSADIRWTGDGVNLICSNGADGIVVFYYDFEGLNDVFTKKMLTPIQSICSYDREDYLFLGGTLQSTASVPQFYIYKINKCANIYSIFNSLDFGGELNINVLGGANVQISGIVNYAP